MEPLKMLIDFYYLSVCSHTGQCVGRSQRVCSVTCMCIHADLQCGCRAERYCVCVCVCATGSNWVELVLMGLYGMFGVISVWGLLWRAGSSGGWLGPLPSAEAVLHFLVFSFILALSRRLSLVLTPRHCHERASDCMAPKEWMFVFPPNTVI